MRTAKCFHANETDSPVRKAILSLGALLWKDMLRVDREVKKSGVLASELICHSYAKYLVFKGLINLQDDRPTRGAEELLEAIDAIRCAKIRSANPAVTESELEMKFAKMRESHERITKEIIDELEIE